jgi:hypothetical protein
MVMRWAILTAMLLAAAGCSGSPPRSATGVVAGPSAEQLAHGGWVRVPTPPVRLCDPHVVWDGRDLVVVEPGFRPCRPAAATYDPKANSWLAIAAPPGFAGQVPVGGWGGGQLVLVSPQTGATLTWNASTGRWHQAATLPSRDAVSVGWTGSEILVITASRTGVNTGTAHAFALARGRWTRLPDLPEPRVGRIVAAPTATDNGAVYALAAFNVAHTNPSDMYDSGGVELLRLTPAAWTAVPLFAGPPFSQLQLTPVDGAILAAGSSCPGLGPCTLEDGAATLLRPGASPTTIPLDPAPGVPYPYDIAAGGGAVVVTYLAGLGNLSPGPPPGTSMIYNISAGTWLHGPTAPDTPAQRAAYWTPYGVLSLANTGGWLLRPAR